MGCVRSHLKYPLRLPVVIFKDDEWADEESLIQGFKPDEFAMLSEMLGPKGKNFENDDLFDHDDEDFKEFPVSHIDMKVSDSSVVLMFCN
jgi:hypothetical protein